MQPLRHNTHTNRLMLLNVTITPFRPSLLPPWQSCFDDLAAETQTVLKASAAEQRERCVLCDTDRWRAAVKCASFIAAEPELEGLKERGRARAGVDADWMLDGAWYGARIKRAEGWDQEGSRRPPLSQRNTNRAVEENRSYQRLLEDYLMRGGVRRWNEVKEEK